MRDSSQGAAEEHCALDLGPAIDLRPARPERAAAPDDPCSADRLERPDSEHPWDDDDDEAEAKETMRMLYDHYHKQVLLQQAFQQRQTLAMPSLAVVKSPAHSQHP